MDKTGKEEQAAPLRCVAQAMAAAADEPETGGAPTVQPRQGYSACPLRHDGALREFITSPHRLAGRVPDHRQVVALRPGGVNRPLQ